MFCVKFNFCGCVQVYRGTWRGTDVAVKRLLQQDIGKDCGMLDAFCQEVTVAMLCGRRQRAAKDK